VSADVTKVGFLGFGEAGSSIAGGLTDAGFTELAAFDIAWESSDLIRERASDLGVVLVSSPRGLAQRVDTVISAVVCSEAANAAGSIMDHLDGDHTYMDINSVAAGVKIGIATRFSKRGLRFLDVAVMGNIKRDLASVPLLVAGPGGVAIMERFSDVPVDATVVSEHVGGAARVKMFRSLFVKGLEALALESMMASYATGTHEQVLASLEHTFGKYTFSGLITHLVERHAVHGKRRADELLEVADSVAEAGVDPIMAEAGHRRMSWDVERGFQDRFPKGEDPNWKTVLQGLHELQQVEAGDE
jgi:3-hydroxyisobutyrate dehydrogenase-like beta-hydroxyacid dehydrogenase